MGEFYHKYELISTKFNNVLKEGSTFIAPISSYSTVRGRTMFANTVNHTALSTSFSNAPSEVKSDISGAIAVSTLPTSGVYIEWAIPLYNNNDAIDGYIVGCLSRSSYSGSFSRILSFSSSPFTYNVKYYSGVDTPVYGDGFSGSSYPYYNSRLWIYNNCLYWWCYQYNAKPSATSVGYAAGATASGSNSGLIVLDLTRLFNILTTLHIKDEGLYSDEYGAPSSAGGYTGGTFDDTSDTIAIPTMPSIGVTSAGFVNVYNPSVGTLQNFGAELFPDLTFSSASQISGSVGITEAIEAAANALVDLGNQIPNIVNMYINSNLINYVIDCHILPVAPTASAAQNIKVGFRQFTASAPIVTSDYVDFDCGSLNIGEYYANFIDYAPYTRAKLFLPFVGFVDLQPEFFQSGTVQIIYRFNIIDGSFMAYVLSTSSKSKLLNSVIMQFGGNACVHIPITGLNYSSLVSGVVGGAASMVASQAGVSGLSNRAGTAITSAITSAVDVAQSKPPVQQSNGYNATTSFLSVRTPYILIERSVSNFSVKYTEEKGVPSNITSDFGTLAGFTQATSVHLDGITATEAEKNEIAALLAQGVIL